LNTTM